MSEQLQNCKITSNTLVNMLDYLIDAQRETSIILMEKRLALLLELVRFPGQVSDPILH